MAGNDGIGDDVFEKVFGQRAGPNPNHAADAFGYRTSQYNFDTERDRAAADRTQQALAEELLRQMMESGAFEGVAQRAYEQVFGRGPVMPRAPANPERAKAIVQLRAIKARRDGTTFAGERENAQAAMTKLMAKHGIEEHEL